MLAIERIDYEQLRIFNSYGGDMNEFVRMNRMNEVKSFGEDLNEKWAFLAAAFHDVDVVAKGRSSFDDTKNTLIRIQEGTDAQVFGFFTNRIGFYDDFQRVKRILETIRGYTHLDTDVCGSSYDSVDEFLVDLHADIERVHFCDVTILAKLEIEFAPTSTYQELSISNGWSEAFLALAECFDRLHEKLKKRYTGRPSGRPV